MTDSKIHTTVPKNRTPVNETGVLFGFVLDAAAKETILPIEPQKFTAVQLAVIDSTLRDEVFCNASSQV